MTEILSVLAELIGSHLWVAPVLCVAAGIVTSFTPCSLSSVPVAIAYIGGSAGKNKKKAFGLSMTMALGMTLTFATFGTIASMLGHFLHEAGMWWHLLLGAIMILMAFQVWGIFSIMPHRHVHADSGKKGYAGAFIAGVVSGVFASHCATPVMIALLALVAEAGSTAWGVFLLTLYAIGHSVLMVAAGIGYSAVDRWINDPKYDKISHRMKMVMGVVILFIGMVMIRFAFMGD